MAASTSPPRRRRQRKSASELRQSLEGVRHAVDDLEDGPTPEIDDQRHDDAEPSSQAQPEPAPPVDPDPQPGASALDDLDLVEPEEEPEPRPARATARPTKAAPGRTARKAGTRAAAAAVGRKEETKVSLPAWLDELVRRLWDTEGASFAELIHESLQTDAARALTEEEARAWRRQQRLQPGTRQRTLRLEPAAVTQIQQLVADSDDPDLGLSTMIAVLLSKHPSIVALRDQNPPGDATRSA